MALTTTTSIPAAVSEYYNRLLLERALPDLIYEMFGQIRPLPQNEGKIAKFRRYEALPTAIVPLTSGVPPSSSDPTKTDITATIKPYGSFIEFTDLVELTSPDPILTEFDELLGEQAGQSIDIIVRDILKLGTSVTYTNGSARNAVTSIFDIATTRKVRRTLRNNNASYLREILTGSTNIGSAAIPRSYVAIVHPDVGHDIRQITGFVGIQDYGKEQFIHESEIGSIPSIQMRFLETTQAPKIAGGGGGTTSIKNTGGSADIYQTIIFARNAYGIVPLRGAALTHHMHERGTSGVSDALDQIGSIGWKAAMTAVILNDNFLHRVESGASS